MSNAPLPSIYSLLPVTQRVKIVDVGANPIDGDVPYGPLLTTGFADVVGFEPNPQALMKLNALKGATEQYLPYAVGDGDVHTLHFCAGAGMTSLLKPNIPLLSMFYNFAELAQVIGTQEVETRRLDDIPETAGMDMLKIDIQGAEMLVFEHAQARLSEAVMVQTEVEFLPMYEGQKLFAEVDQFMRGMGFMLHRFEPMYSRTLKPVDPYACMQQIMWADAIYVRDLTRLDGLSAGQLLKSAIILHDCYRAYDVALKMLEAHDRQAGTNYAEQYLAVVRHAQTAIVFANKARA